MKQETVTGLVKIDEEGKPLIPCQLEKIWAAGRIQCSFDCAIDHGCPVFYIDEHEQPILAIRR